MLERAGRHLCGNAAVRFDAGYPGEPLMAALEERGTHIVARVRNNAVLKRLALPAMDAAVWDALSGTRPLCRSSKRPGKAVTRGIISVAWSATARSPNAGRPNAPRIARRHLPRKAPAEASLGEEPGPRERSSTQIVQSIIR